MYGLELGNFIDPEIAIADSYNVIFTCYASGEQGKVTSTITVLPWIGIPDRMDLNPKNIPSPPVNIAVANENGSRIITWKKEKNL